MFKLVVLSALLAFAAAAPGYLTGAHPAPVAYTSYAAPAVAYAAPAIAYAAPAVATAITKQVHYASHPVVTGYNAQVIKPNLGAIATPAEIVSQTKVLAPARSVQTITPQVTQIQPEVSIQKVAVDVPVQTPYVSHVEVRTPTVAAYPAPVAVKSIGYAAPAVAYGAVNTYGYAAPAVAYGAHVKSYAAPAVAYGAVNTYGYAAPAVAYGAHVKSFAAPALAYGAANYGYSGYGFAAPALAYGTHVKTVY